jgi:hypothetical protein
LFFETSARNGTGINDIFEKTAELVHLKLLNDIVRPDGTIGIKVNNIIENLIIINNQKQTKTIMVDDLIETLQIMNINITKSNDLNISTYK